MRSESFEAAEAESEDEAAEEAAAAEAASAQPSAKMACSGGQAFSPSHCSLDSFSKEAATSPPGPTRPLERREETARRSSSEKGEGREEEDSPVAETALAASATRLRAQSGDQHEAYLPAFLLYCGAVICSF